MSRPYQRPDGNLTRTDVAYYTDAESAIALAMSLVEGMGASENLTEAVTLLSDAKDKVADHVEIREEDCPGHVASEFTPKVCGLCGTHIDSLRP